MNIRKVLETNTKRMVIGIILMLLTTNSVLGASWWDESRSFRLPVTVGVAGYERYDKPIEVNVNFTQLINGLGKTGTLDENSIGVIEVDSTGTTLNTYVMFQLDKDSNYDATTNALTNVIFIMNGTTPATNSRYYHIYFNLTGGSFLPTSVAPLVTLTDNVTDEGQSSYRIVTINGTYYFQKQAGGFSSLVDTSGNDWIGFSTIPGSAGTYRGIPNSNVSIFHPGYVCCTSDVVSQGPIKAKIRTISNDERWESIWEFYPKYATMTMVKAGYNYWVLYEGTPGGVFEPDIDLMARYGNENMNILSQSWSGDIVSDEWAYFSDPNVNPRIGRSLFVAHHEDDTLTDSYRPVENNMTVFGFGRISTTPLLSSVPQRFTIGLMDGISISQNSKRIYSSYKDLTIAKGTVEQYLSIVYVPPSPISPASIQGNFWIRHTWQPGGGNKTDSYNISINGNSSNTTNNYYNDSAVGPHGWSNISIYAYNNSGGLSSMLLGHNVQLDNNIPVQDEIGDKIVIVGGELMFTVSAIDEDYSDIITYSTNATRGTLNPATGVYSFTPDSADVGDHTWSFSSRDNYGGTDIENVMVTVSGTSLLSTNITDPKHNAKVSFVNNVIQGKVTGTNIKSAMLKVKNEMNVVTSSYNLTLTNTKFAQRVEYLPSQKNTIELIATDDANNISKASITINVGNNTYQSIEQVNMSEPVTINAKNETGTEIVFMSNVARLATFRLVADTNITEIAKLNNVTSRNSETVLGRIVDIQVDGIDVTNETDVQNVTISMYYTKKDLDIDGDGVIETGELDENKMSFYWYNVSNNGWEKLSKGNPQWVIDSGIVKISAYNAGYAWVKVRHLSKFALVAGQKIQATTSNTRSSSSGSSGPGGGSNIGSNEYFGNIDARERRDLYIFKDIVTQYLFISQKIPVTSVNITGKENTAETSVLVEALKNTSRSAKVQAPGMVYKNVNIMIGMSSTSVSRYIKSITINFRVENSWINKSNNDIKMVMRNGSKWTTLETVEKMNDSNYTYFEAKTDKLSNFAITKLEGKGKETKQKVQTIPKSQYKNMTKQLVQTSDNTSVNKTSILSTRLRTIPGFEIVVGIMALLIIYIFRKR